jgi:hypothetical protein
MAKPIKIHFKNRIVSIGTYKSEKQVIQAFEKLGYFIIDRDEDAICIRAICPQDILFNHERSNP